MDFLRNHDGQPCSLNGSAVFALEEEGEEGALQVVFSGEQVVVVDGGLGVATSGNATRFSIIRGADGEPAALRANGVSFAVDPRVPVANQHCCGARSVGEGADVQWDRVGHEWSVRNGTRMTGSEIRNNPNVRTFLDTFWANQQFQEQVFQGLIDADDRSPWNEPVRLGKALYAYHFFDPKTWKTLMPIFAGYEKFNAVSEGQRYFYLAVHAGRRIVQLGAQAPANLYAMAGHYFGLALHFLTDLTQPMHTAGFANVVGLTPFEPVWLDDYRHQKFEDLADQGIRDNMLQPGDVMRSHVEQAEAFANVGELFVRVARHGREVWDETLRKVATNKPRTADAWPWDARHSAPVKDALQFAPVQAAKLMVHYAKAVRQKLGDFGIHFKRWYKVVEPTRGEVLSNEGNKIRRWKWDGGDRQLVSFTFHEDGSASFFTKSDLSRTWRVNDYSGTGYLEANTGTPDLWARFRLIPFQEKACWLYTDYRIVHGARGADEVVCVYNDAGNNGLGGRWQPEMGKVRASGDTETQIFEFHEVRAMTDAEVREVEASGRSFAVPWFGTP